MPDPTPALPSSFVADGNRLGLRAYIFLILVCLAFFAPGLAALPPTDRDESSFAQATKQMIQSDDYRDIHIQSEPRYQKPIGIYWLQAASVRLLDPHHLKEIWAYRVPSLIGATAAVLATAAIGSLLFGPVTGLLAALMMAGCVMLNVEARMAKTDACLLGSITWMQYALARASKGKSGWGNALLFWTALGASILIKGPIGLLVLFSTLLWLRLAEKNLKWFSALKPWAGIPWLLLLIAPWFVVIMLRTHGAFATQSAGHDLFAKLWEGQSRGIMPPGLHALAMPVIFFPFSLFVLLAIYDSWKNRGEPAVRFCLGWIIPAWIVFELSLTKLPHYTLPLYPAIAMLAAKALTEGYPALTEKGGQWIWASAVALWLTMGTGFAVAFALLPYLDHHAWNGAQIAAGAGLMIAQGLALAMLILRRRADSVIILAAGSLCFMMAIFGSTLPGLQHVWLSRQVVRMAERIKPCAHSTLISFPYDEPSLVFMAGSDTVLVTDEALIANAMELNPCNIGLVDEKHEPAFLGAFPPGRAPRPRGTIEGLNIGHGGAEKLTLYTMPQKPESHDQK